MKINITSLLFFILFLVGNMQLVAQGNDTSIISKTSYDGIKFRSIGPALTSGRIADIAIDPEDENIWYVAVASGGVWKTTNAGTTWSPVFDHESSYSIGSVTIDPNNSSVIWVGTGEGVGGRHVGFGDGVYKSTDGGETWTNMGLEKSEHISKIVVNPDNSSIIWVAAQGPLWNGGGQRGLYKSIDGGENWKKVLGGNKWTGVTDLVIDPRNPDRMYAAMWQRERTTAAFVSGGPGSGIYKSTDGGVNWKELRKGLPHSNMGKIGLTISPQEPDIIYAVVTAGHKQGGFYKSNNRGASWHKMSSTVSGHGPQANYYQKIFASPHYFGTIYLMDAHAQISHDQGATFHYIKANNKHGDNHAMAFRNGDPNFLLMGTDGGLYESSDLGDNWNFINNMPITQFYHVAVDDAKPFYHVYGGAQDNGSQVGPSRTENENGITNADWQMTTGADGYDTATEPGNPDILYAETQRGRLYRIDRTTGDKVLIQPQVGKKDGANHFERFNWNAPLAVNPKYPKRILFGSQRVWISNNRGNSWTTISSDLTLNQNRLKLPIMGKQQSYDSRWQMFDMAKYNTITALAESPLQKGLIYAGTDDGRIQVTGNEGKSWHEVKLSQVEGVPAKAFVNDIEVSHFNKNTVYVAMDNHKNGDFNPYLIKSTNRGKSWKVISKGLPDRHFCWSIKQDYEDKDLLFVATEFGIFFTIDGGKNWQQLNGGVATIAFRDLAIQRNRDDLIGASFGRGFYILDDYAPLRKVNKQTLNKEAVLFTPRKTFWYVPNRIVQDMGANYFRAKNPPYGAVFTYYLKDGYKSLKAKRQQKESELAADEDVHFPGWDSLETEIREKNPTIVLTIKNKSGIVVNEIEGPTTEGFHRINWELNYSSKEVIEKKKSSSDYSRGGFMATPGTYTATLSKILRGKVTQLSGPVTLKVVPLRKGVLKEASYESFNEFRKKLEEFQQNLTQTTNKLQDQIKKIDALQRALSRANKQAPKLVKKLNDARIQLGIFSEQLNGSRTKRAVGQLPRFDKSSPRSRLLVGYQALQTTYGPTQMDQKTIEIGEEELAKFKEDLANFTKNIMRKLEEAVKDAGAPPIKGN